VPTGLEREKREKMVQIVEVTDDDITPRCARCTDYVEYIGEGDGPVCKSNCSPLTRSDVVFIANNELRDDETFTKIWDDPMRRGDVQCQTIMAELTPLVEPHGWEVDWYHSGGGCMAIVVRPTSDPTHEIWVTTSGDVFVPSDFDTPLVDSYGYEWDEFMVGLMEADSEFTEPIDEDHCIKGVREMFDWVIGRVTAVNKGEWS